MNDIGTKLDFSPKEKNLDIFLENLFFGSTEEKAAIALEVQRLCRIMPIQLKSNFPLIEQIENTCESYILDKPTTLESVLTKIRENKLLTLCYIPAFISSEITLSSYNIAKFDHYKALTFFVVAHLSIEGEHESKIYAVCNEIRQYAFGSRELLSAHLPTLHDKTLQHIIDSLYDLLQEDFILGTPVAGQINNIKRPYRDYYNNRPGFHRKSSSREFKGKTALSISSKVMPDENQSTNVLEIKDIRLVEKKFNKSWEEEEENSKIARSIVLITDQSFTTQANFHNMLQARAINERVRKKSMFLTCDISAITVHELRSLINHCTNDIQQLTQHKLEAIICLFMLLTGNTLDDIRKWKLKRNCLKEITGIIRTFRLPSQKVRDELTPVLQRVTEHYIIPLPKALTSQVNNFKFSEVTTEKVQTYLSKINKLYGITLSLQKITRTITQIMTYHRVDHVLIDLITGYDIQNQPARFYTYIPNSRLESIYQRYSKYLAKLSNNPSFFEIKMLESVRSLGSPLYIDHKIVRQIICSLKGLITHYRPSLAESYYSEQSHNLRVLFLQILLGLSSGYRPVNGWFGTIKDIHLSTGEYRIAEKEREVGYRGRTVVLPDVTIRAIKEYLTYCQQSILYFENQSRELNLRYKQCLSGQTPFCFYRRHNKIEEVSPSTYLVHMDPIFPIQANWTRHYLRSFLFEHQVSSELIHAWLGHLHSEQLPFEQFSQLNRHSLRDISNLIGKHLENLVSGQNDD